MLEALTGDKTRKGFFALKPLSAPESKKQGGFYVERGKYNTGLRDEEEARMDWAIQTAWEWLAIEFNPHKTSDALERQREILQQNKLLQDLRRHRPDSDLYDELCRRQRAHDGNRQLVFNGVLQIQSRPEMSNSQREVFV